MDTVLHIGLRVGNKAAAFGIARAGIDNAADTIAAIKRKNGIARRTGNARKAAEISRIGGAFSVNVGEGIAVFDGYSGCGRHQIPEQTAGIVLGNRFCNNAAGRIAAAKLDRSTCGRTEIAEKAACFEVVRFGAGYSGYTVYTG